MKIKKLIMNLNRAEFEHKLDKVKKLWFKILKNSVRHKHTEAVR